MGEYNTGKSFVDNFTGIRGTVKIENGEHLVIGRNHWVGQGFMTIGSYLAYSGSLYGGTTHWGIYLGSDTTTVTTVSMTALKSPIGGGPNTSSYSSVFNPSSSTPVVLIYTGTWNAGTVSGTLGEVGLYLNLNTAGLSGGINGGSAGLVSRLSAADGSFTAFTINTAAALTVTWTVNLVYS
jgi:hypothetical protein